MRKELEYHEPDKTKLETAKTLIDSIANGEGDTEKALNELGKITGKQHSQTEFAEYWGWTDLDTIAQQALMEPPCVRDLTRDELIEIISITREAMTDSDSKMTYYMELLHKSLPLADVLKYIMSPDDCEKIADDMLLAARQGVILL